jgi:hypothetical protein
VSDVFDFLHSRDTADRLITKFGGAAAVIRDVATGSDWAPVLTPTPFATFAVRVEFTWKQLQDAAVLTTDQRWLVAAGPLFGALDTMLPSDRLSAGGVEMTIVKASPLKPAAVVVMYDCQVRV